MSDLTTRLLGEIELREQANETLAYLAALQKIVAVHMRALRLHPAATPTCPWNPDCACDHCIAIGAVAEALGVAL